jgi:tetratricopeptide (TPR) repeat protein
MLHASGASLPPSAADVHKLIAQLRDDLGQDVRTEVADRLLQLVGTEPHPGVQAALLERAARLVAPGDRDRAIGLLRESFRQYPTVRAGRMLRELAEDDATMARLGRLGHLVDAVAELAQDPTVRAQAWLEAARTHLQLGHGLSAQHAADRLRNLQPEHPDVAELLDIAENQQASRAEILTAQRMAIGEATDDARPQALMAYAELLLAGEEPLADAAAVLADAVDSGAPLHEVAPLWVEVARSMGDPQELVRSLAAALRAGDALPQRLQYADELANITGIDRTEPAVALEALTALTDALPDDQTLRARREVARALTASGEQRENVLESQRQAALHSRDRDGEAVVCLALAWLAQEQGDPEKAERHYRRVRTLAPQNAEALDFFESWYRNQGDHKRLLVALTQRLAISEGRDIVRVAIEIAQLCEGPLATPERAVEAWQRVLAVQPDHPDATAALERLYQQQGRWHAMRDLLDRAARTQLARTAVDPNSGEQAAALLSRIAGLHEDAGKLPDAEMALAAWQQVLAVQPRHPQALTAVVADALAHGEQAKALLAIENAAAAATDAHEIADLSARAAVLHGDAGRDEAAAAWWQRALQACPDRTDLAAQLVETARRLGQDDGMLDALLGLLHAAWQVAPGDLQPEQVSAVLARDPDGVAMPALEEASALAEVAGREALALHLYKLLLAAQPGHLAALAGLGRLSQAEGPAQSLALLLKTQLDHADLPEDRRVAVLEQLATLQVGALHDGTSAEQTATQLLALAPQSTVAQSIRARSLVERGDLAALRALYPETPDGDAAFAESALAAAPLQAGGAQVALLLAAGRTLARHEGQHERAAVILGEALHAALTAAPQARESLVAEAGEALLEQARTAGLIGLQREAVDALADHAQGEASLKWKRLRVDLCDDAGLPAEAATAAAELAEELLVSERWQDLPQMAERHAQLATLAGEPEAAAERVAAWADIAEDAPRDVVSALWRIVLELSQNLGDLSLSRRAVDGVLLGHPDDTALLRQRERIATQQEDWPAVVQTLERLAQVVPAGERADLLLRAAGQHDLTVGQPRDAERLYRAVLAERPDSLEAHAGLLAALRQTGDAQALSDALDAYLPLPGVGRESRAHAALERMELAAAAGHPRPLEPVLAVVQKLAEQPDLDEAESTLVAVAIAQLDMPDSAALVAEALLPVLRKHGRDDEALRCLGILADQASDPATRSERFMALADLVEREAPEQAYAAVRSALASTPERPDLAERAVRLAAKTGQDADLDVVLLALGGEAELPDVRPVEDPQVRARLLTLRAERAQRAGDAATAANLYTLLNALTPLDLGPLESLEALYREAGDLDAVAVVIEERLQARVPDDDRLQLWMRLASLHGDERGLEADAEEVLTRAVAEMPESQELWTAWLGVLRDLGDRKKLAEALQRRLDRPRADSEDVDERQAARLEVADLLDQGDDRIAALQHWLEALEVDPSDTTSVQKATETWLALAETGVPPTLAQAAERLETVLDARGDFTDLDHVLSAQARAAQGLARKAILLRQAFLRERGLTEPTLAFESLAAALALDPTDESVLAEVLRLGAGGTDAHPKAAAVGRALSEASAGLQDPPARRALRLQALTWLTGEGEAQTVLRDTYDAMLADDPSDTDALDGLDRLTLATGDDRARLLVLAARAKVSPKEEQNRLLLEHARLLVRLGDEVLGIKELRGILGSGEVEVRREAAATLCELHEHRGEQRELADALMVLRGTMEDPDSRLQLTLRAAAVLAKYGDGERARTMLLGERIEHPRNPEIHAAIEDLVRLGGDRAVLIDHLKHGWTQVFAGEGQDAERRQVALQWLTARQGTAPRAATWPDLQEILDAGLRGPELDAWLAELSAVDDAAVAQAAARRHIALLHEAGDAAGEVAARLEWLDRWGDAKDARTEREAVATLLEGPLDDPESALSQWQVLLSSGPLDERAVTEAQRLADKLGRGAEIDDEVRHAAARLPDVAERNRARMQLVERAYGRDEMGRMADLLDEVLTDVPGHAEAFGMRGAVLTELPEWHHRERLAAHWRHGMAHATGAVDRRTARLELARLLHHHLGGSGEAFDLVCAQLTEQPDAADATELLELGQTYGHAAGRPREVQALLHDAAARAEPGPVRAERLLLLAERCLAHDDDPEAATRFADQAWHEAGPNPRLLTLLDTTVDRLEAPSAELLERLASERAQEQPTRAAHLLQRALDGKADLPAALRLRILRALVAVAPAVRQAGATLDTLAATRELALAEPELAAHWQALDEATRDRPGELVEALLEASQTVEAPGLRHDLLARAAHAAQASGDVDTASTAWRLALEAEPRPESREALRAVLLAAGRHDELALDLEAEAETAQGDAAADLLARAAVLWSGPAHDPARGLVLYRKLAELRPDDPALADQQLAALQAAGDPRYGEALATAVEQARGKHETARLQALLQQQLELAKAAPARFAIVRELRQSGMHSPAIATVVAELAEDSSALDRTSAREVHTWRMLDLDPEREPSEWLAARLQGLDLQDDPAVRQATWLDVARHARDRLHDHAQALEWTLQAMTPAPASEALQQLPVLVQDSQGARQVLEALAPLLTEERTDHLQLATTGFELGERFLGEDPALAPFAEALADTRLDAALWLEDSARERGDAEAMQGLLRSRALRMEAAEPDAAVDAWMQLTEGATGPARTEALDRVLALRPDHEGALHQRLQVAVTAGDGAKVATLAEALGDAATPDERVAQATALQGQGREEPALHATEAALAHTPGHVPALRLRADLLGQMGRQAEARTALLEVIQAIGDVGALPLLVQAARMARAAGEPDEAATLLARAFAAEPGDTDAWHATEEGKGDAKFLAAAVTTIAPVLRGVGQAARAADLQAAALQHLPASEKEAATRALATTLADDLGQPEQAVTLLLDLARKCAEPIDVLEQAGDIARRGDRVDLWVDGVADLVTNEDLPVESVVPAVALAAAALSELGQPGRAADLWQAAWDLDPDSQDAREMVLGLRREAGDLQRLAGDLERALMLGGGEAAPLRLELAEIKRTTLGRPREALRLVLDVLSEDPRDADALVLAGELMRTPAVADEALAELEPLFRGARQWQGLATVLQVRLERPIDPTRKANLAAELARLQSEQIGDHQQSVRALAVAVQARPSLPTLTALQAAATPEDAGLVAEAIGRVLAASLPPEQLAEVLRRAVAFEDQRGDQDAAERHLRDLVDLMPDDAEAFEQLESRLDAGGRWDEVIALWRHRLAQATDPDARRVGLHRLAGIARAIGRNDVALQALRDQAKLDPSDADPILAILEIVREQDQPAQLAEALVLLGRAQGKPHDRAEALCEAARLYQRTLKQAERAADAYDEAFRADPTHDEAFVFLERQAGHEARRLEPLYAQRAAGLPPGPARTLMLRKLAQACTDRGDGEGACQALERALDDDQGNSVVLEDLLRLAEHNHVWPSFVRAAERKLTGDVRRDVQVSLHGHLARIALTELPDPTAVERHLAALQQLAPGEAVTRHLQALAQAHSGDPQESAAGLEQMIREAEDVQTQISLHQQLADLYAGPLQNPAKAIREYQKLLTLDPRRWTVRRKLCDLYAARQSPEAQAECLRQWIAALAEGDGRATMRMELGGELVGLYTELGEVLLVLGQTAESTVTLRQAHALGGDNARVDRVLLPLLEQSGDFLGALKLEEWLIGHEDDGIAERSLHAGQLAELAKEPARARDHFRKALDLLPDDDVAMLGLGRAHLKLGETDRAMRLFDAVGRRAGASAALRADALVGLGRCRAVRHQPAQARACYDEAMALVPGHKDALLAKAEL